MAYDFMSLLNKLVIPPHLVDKLVGIPLRHPYGSVDSASGVGLPGDKSGISLSFIHHSSRGSNSLSPGKKMGYPQLPAGYYDEYLTIKEILINRKAAKLRVGGRKHAIYR